MSTAALRQSLTSVRSRMRVSEAEMRRTGAAYGSAFVLGILSKPAEGETESRLSKMGFAGMPGTVTVAILAKGAATFADGEFGDYLNGAGDAAAIMALADFARGRAVEGMASEGASSSRAERLERTLRRRLSEQRRRAAREEIDDDGETVDV